MERQHAHLCAATQQAADKCPDLEEAVDHILSHLSCLQKVVQGVERDKAIGHANQRRKGVAQQERENAMEARICELQRLVEEREQVRDVISKDVSLIDCGSVGDSVA